MPNGSYVVVSAEVKNAGRNIEVNAINTISGRSDISNVHETIEYVSEQITPEQSSLLNRPNSDQYPTEQELPTGKGTESAEPVQANEEEKNAEEARKQRLSSVNTNVFPESYDLYGVKSTLYDYQNGLATYVDAEGIPCIFLAANETGSAYVGVFRDASGWRQ